MKGLTLTFGLLVFFSITLLAQAPKSFKYQAISRDAEGNIISNQQLNLRISLLQNNENGNIVYSEIHQLKTNQFGLINLEIGKGKNKTGEFSSINWGISKYFVQLEMDMKGGDNFVKMGVSQLLSVPYALYAETSGNPAKATTSGWETVGTRTYLKNLNSKVSIGTTIAPGKLIVNQDNNADALIVTGGGLGKNIASFIRDVGSNGRIDFNVCGADPQIRFDVEGGGTRWFTGVDDNPSDYFQIGFGGTTLSGSTRAITVDDVNGYVGIGTASPGVKLDIIGNIKASGTLQIENGTSINEISTDGTLSGDSDDAVPTEKVVKAYIDALEAKINNLVAHSFTTTAASAISFTTATSGGNIGPAMQGITIRGVCWNTSAHPTIADNITTNGSGTGSFTSQISGLSKKTTYYVRAYATNSSGTAYGNEVSFTTKTCPVSFTDSRDGNSYNTVEIGDQCWMAENINIGTMISGANNQTNNGVIEKYCYNNIASNCDIYGGLYQWKEMMQYNTTLGAQGICPAGWYIPTDEEWKKLEGTVDSQYGYPDPEWETLGYRGYDAGGNLKETGTTHWLYTYSGYGTNTSGFTALGCGFRTYSGSFAALHYYTDFWTSTNTFTYNNKYAYVWTLIYASDRIKRGEDWVYSGNSLRCLKDN